MNPPYYCGYEFWVVNDKGFFWEPADNAEMARELAEKEALLGSTKATSQP